MAHRLPFPGARRARRTLTRFSVAMQPAARRPLRRRAVTLRPVLSLLAIAALGASSAHLAAQTIRVVTLTASTLTPLFATISPVVDVVDFRAPTAADVHDGWVSGTTTVVDDRSRVPHVVTIVALSGCADAGEDAVPGVQWSVDDGRTWHDLTYTPQSLGLHGDPPAPVSVARLRYRRRAARSTSACTIRAQLTPVPRR